MTRSKILILCVLFAWLTPVSGQQKAIPSMELTTLNGETVNLLDYCTNGKITVINFWATWCAPCKQELDNIAKIFEYWQEDYGVEYIAVNMDSKDNRARVLKQSKEWPFTILLDEQGLARERLNVEMPPYTILVDQKGKVVTHYTGYKAGDEIILEEKIKALR